MKTRQLYEFWSGTVNYHVMYNKALNVFQLERWHYGKPDYVSRKETTEERLLEWVTLNIPGFNRRHYDLHKQTTEES
jgi:hypothetical protein